MRTQGVTGLAVRLASLTICGGALMCAAIALAAACGGINANLDVLTHLTPLYLAAAVVCLIASLPLPTTPRRFAASAASVAICACCALMGPEYLAARPPPPPGDGAHDLKLIEFNIWGGNKNPEPALAWLLKQDADVVVMEEGGPAQALLKLGKYHMSCGNCYGEVFTKVEPKWSNTPANWRIKPQDITVVRLDDSAEPVTVLAVHRSWAVHPRVFEPEMADLARVAARYPKRYMIVAGDFNSTPWSFAMRREDRQLGLTRRTRALFTWPANAVSHDKLPAPFPVLPIDQVYAGPGWATVRVERGPKLGSDHYPVIVTLRRIDDSASAAAARSSPLVATR